MNPLFKNIPHAWVFLALDHLLYLCICVFVYLCICVFVVGSFIIKSQGQEEVKNLEDLLSKFNIRLVKTLLLSQSWESFQT